MGTKISKISTQNKMLLFKQKKTQASTPLESSWKKQMNYCFSCTIIHQDDQL